MYYLDPYTFHQSLLFFSMTVMTTIVWPKRQHKYDRDTCSFITTDFDLVPFLSLLSEQFLQSLSLSPVTLNFCCILQAATPCCANYLWSKGGYLRFSHSMTHRLHKKGCFQLSSKLFVSKRKVTDNLLIWKSFVIIPLLFRVPGMEFVGKRYLPTPQRIC